MLNITSFTPASKDLIINLTNSGESRSTLVSICVAKAIADTLVIPQAVQDGIANYYNRINAIPVLRILSIINEQTLLDSDKVSGLIKSFYTYRYQLAHAPGPVLLGNEHVILDFFGITNILSINDIEVIQTDSIKTMKYYNGFLNLVRELNALDIKA